MDSSDKGPPSIRSKRLELVWTSPAFLQASLDGRRAEAERLIGAALPETWPGDVERVRQELKRVLDAPEEEPWLGYSIKRRADGIFVGGIGFHGKPDDRGQVELGYDVEAPFRRQGYASEAAVALMRWAHSAHGISRFVVRISAINEPSLAMAVKLGFVKVREETDDEDGEMYVFELNLDA